MKDGLRRVLISLHDKLAKYRARGGAWATRLFRPQKRFRPRGCCGSTSASAARGVPWFQAQSLGLAAETRPALPGLATPSTEILCVPRTEWETLSDRKCAQHRFGKS